MVKEKTSQLKEQKETLSKQKITAEETLQQLLFQIQNIPHQSVPYGQSDEDNEEIFRCKRIQHLMKVHYLIGN